MRCSSKLRLTFQLRGEYHVRKIPPILKRFGRDTCGASHFCMFLFCRSTLYNCYVHKVSRLMPLPRLKVHTYSAPPLSPRCPWLIVRREPTPTFLKLVTYRSFNPGAWGWQEQCTVAPSALSLARHSGSPAGGESVGAAAGHRRRLLPLALAARQH